MIWTVSKWFALCLYRWLLFVFFCDSKRQRKAGILRILWNYFQEQEEFGAGRGRTQKRFPVVRQKWRWNHRPRRTEAGQQAIYVFTDMSLVLPIFPRHLISVAFLLKARSDRARQRASTVDAVYLHVMYAYSSSCQLRHFQLRHCIVNDVISTGVVWWSLARTFWPFSPIAYV